MLSYYKRLFDSFRSVYPECYQEVINEFICLKMRYYQQNVGLGVIEILGILRNFKEDPLNQEAYADLYSDYGGSDFLCKNLDEEQIQRICQRYLQGFLALGKEYGCVIQKTT